MAAVNGLSHTARTAATLAAMISVLLATVAPGDDVATTQPTTTQFVTTQAVTTTQAAGPTTLTVVIEQPVPPRPATRAVPTTAQILEAARKGDVFVQTGEAIGNLGIRETLDKTLWWEWGYALGVALAGIFLGRLVAGVLRRFGRRAGERLQLVRAVAINSFAGPVGAFLVTFGLVFGLSRIDLTPQVIIALIHGWQLAVIALVGWLLYNLVEVVSLLILRASRGRQGNLSMMIVPVTRRTLRALVIIGLLLFVANNVFQVSISGVLGGAAIAGLAISLAAQDTLKNLFGSVMIFTDQPFLIGDAVKMDAIEGVVEDIGFRSTRIRTPDGFLVSIPNAKVADAAITNLSRRKAIRRVVDLGLPYGTTPAKVEEALAIVREILADAAIDGEFDRTREKPSVALDQLRPNLLRMRIVYWFRATDARAYAEHAERLNLAIIRRLHEAGIPFGWAN